VSLTLLVAILCGGLGGAVFTWFANRRFRLPPVLQMRLVRREGERGRIRHADGSFENARYYHLRVSNSRRWSPANDVQVFLTRVEEPGPDGMFQVSWVGDVPMRWRNQESSPLTRTIGHEADCDLCCVREGRSLDLQPLITPFSLNAQKNEGCRIALLLQARSTQADSDIHRIEISWDGNWEDGDTEIQRHLGITVSGVSATGNLSGWHSCVLDA
jgi:hypothetical protein